MRKLEALKVGGVQKEEKEKKNKRILWVRKLIFSSYFFITHFPLHLKDDFPSLR